ncbi:hypothetical protein Shyhy01_25230 [Streptomyces hygroscopicus subsp. hygroscopicus]|nr:hypothetical protein Shyhy01_25230 [Streptomyces hygroscopicus subsp. hygroscopicus]
MDLSGRRRDRQDRLDHRRRSRARGPGPHPPVADRIDRDADEVMEDVRDHVVGNLGHSQAVLAVGDRRFPEGRRSAGLQRRYPATTGRAENGRIGVFLTHAAPRLPAGAGGLSCSFPPACRRLHGRV